MGTVKSLDKEISYYLPRLSSRQKETVLTVVKTFAEEETVKWTDKAFITEMDRRFAEMETGKVKTYSLEEVEAETRKSYKRRKNRK